MKEKRKGERKAKREGERNGKRTREMRTGSEEENNGAERDMVHFQPLSNCQPHSWSQSIVVCSENMAST